MEYFKRTFQSTHEIKSLFQDTTYFLIQEYHNCLAALDRADSEVDKQQIKVRIDVIEKVLERMGFVKYNPL